MTEENVQAASTGTENQAPITVETPSTDTVDYGDKETPSLKADSIDQEKVNKRINELTFQKYEQQRQREKIEKENEELKAKLAKQDSDLSISIPDMPDVFDPEYDTKVKAREDAIKQSTIAEQKREAKKAQEEAAAQEKTKLRQEKIDQGYKKMLLGAKNIGLTDAEIQQADRTVSMFIKDPSLAQFILDQENSAEVVQYLAGSMPDLEKISSMDSINAAAFLASKVIPAASKYSPRLSNAPEPLETLSGKAANINADPFLKGVVFE